MTVKQNIGGFDRILRIGISLVMVYFGFINESIITDEVAGSILGIFGLASLLVAVIGVCPLYSVIEFNTCNSKDET